MARSPPMRGGVVEVGVGGVNAAARWLLGLVLVLGVAVNVSLAAPLCTDMEAPISIAANLSFCSAPEYHRYGCCAHKDDRAIMHAYNAMNITDARCAATVKQILCARCDAYSATLFGQVMAPDERRVPYLCSANSTTSGGNASSQGYCHDVWDACFNVTIRNSPFAPQLNPGAAPPSSSSSSETLAFADGSLGSVFASEADFCAGFGPSSDGPDYCFSGGGFVPPAAPVNTSIPQSMCVEKVGEGVYLNLVPLPDGSDRAAVTTQTGMVWLATLPGPGNALVYDASKPFLDLTSRVTMDNELGFLGFAFHPDYANNGRFFVSYNCDKEKWADCGGTCACNDDTNCNPTHLREGEPGGDSTTDPCRYSSIIAEYTVNTTGSAVRPLEAEVANPEEVNRIFLMSLPYEAHHAGQILFGPTDGYLYFMMGDGGASGDPFNFAQNTNSLLGKIMRLDVDRVPSVADNVTQTLFGQYGIPPDNPYVGQNKSRPEIWALGLRNPWRCSFDDQYPSYFYCADVGQERLEEVDLISKGGNYGWRVYEGNLTYRAPLAPGGNTSARSIHAISPVMMYGHPAGNPQEFSSSITGGYVSYSREDACLYGKYVYADLFGEMYAGEELPRFSGRYTTQTVNYSCSANSPINCTYQDATNSVVSLQEVLSFGVDNSHHLYILAGNGVYRVVNPSNCKLTCDQVLPALPPSASPTPSPFPFSPGPSPAPSGAQSSRLLELKPLRLAMLAFWLLCFVAL